MTCARATNVALAPGTALTPDRALALQVEPGLEPWVERWRPRTVLDDRETRADRAALIRVVRRGRPGDAGPTAASEGGVQLTLGAVELHGTASDLLLMRGRSPRLRGWIRLRDLRARIEILDASARLCEEAEWDAYSMLTLAAALLLGRLERAVVHAGAVVAPDGGAWLLAGDTHAGKSTMCASLIARGWNYLSDDHVVVWRSGDGILATGWLRPFHLDDGWTHGSPTGERSTVEPTTLGPGRPLVSANVRGVLLPRIEAELPTRVFPASPGEALAALIRQSPWLMADVVSTPGLLELFRGVAAIARLRVRLGLDVYGRPEALEDRLLEAFSHEERTA